MDRIREARRSTMAANGLTRRRHRTNSLRDSPEEDGTMELQEPSRLRDRGGTGKKDRDRERDRDRDRERERDRLGRSKKRRGDRLMHSSREDGVEDTSEESINDEDDDDDEDGGGGSGSASVRMLPLNPSSLSNHHRKSFPPAKVFRPTPPSTWKAADEMIGVSVPRKARSASTKRSHECWASSGSGIVAEQNHRQPSTSPVRAASPSSSNASVRKKIVSFGIRKQNGGAKFRPPKTTTSKPSSSAQEEIEIEIAEVLYGMMRQPQGPSKQEIIANESSKFDSREPNKSSTDAKSPISNPQNSSSSATPMSAVAPKRKRPRPVKHEDENPSSLSVRSSPISSTMKAESDQPSKIETFSSNLDKNVGSVTEAINLVNSQTVQASSEPVKPESNASLESKQATEEAEKQKDVGSSEVVVPQSPKKESPIRQVADDDREDVKATKANPSISESENHWEEKFPIDLMAPPPPLRSSPERDVENNLVVDAEKEAKPVVKEDEKALRMNKEEAMAIEMERVKAKAEENDSQKAGLVQKERGIDLQLDLEKADRGDPIGNVGSMVNKKQQHQNVQRQQQQQTNSEKNVQPNSLPLPLSVPSWPGGLPPMGYMTPLQGVVSMDGTTVTSAAIPPPHLLFNQPRPKRCATHCYIARNILYHQQIARMNPFWPAAAGSASLYGAKPSNLNVVPPTELHGNVSGRAANSSQDKGHGVSMFSGHMGKDKASQPANVDNSSRKQILLQQALPPGAPSNILHGPTFIFPLNQQQAAAAASVRPGSVKSLPVSSNGTPSSVSNSAPPNASGTGAAAAAAPTMSFSYPNMPGNETPYLAILQNNAYSFPIPAHVGGPPGYRATPHAQAFPFFNGSFYPSQMIHPSQIQQQQIPAQSQQNQQVHQNTSMSSGSSSSQKQHAQNQQQKPNNIATGSNGVGSLQGFPVSKNPPSQPLQLQQQPQQRPNHHTSHPARQIEYEMGGEDSPSTADSRLTRATMNIYGPNFALPMQTPNFALMTPTSISGAGSNGGHTETKQAQQHPGQKAGGETAPAFAMSFAPINGASAPPGLDLSSIAQNHSIMQSNHNYHIMAAAQAASAQLKKNYHTAEEGKNVNTSNNIDEERKAMSGKIPATMGQSIAFGRPDVTDPSLTSISGGNNVVDTSGRNLNIGSASSRASASVMPAAISTNAATTPQQMQRNQMIQQHQKQNQFAAAAAATSRTKTPSSNGNVYSDNLPSTSSMATKFPNAVSAFPQSSSAVGHSAQWKNNVRATTTSQSPPSMASTAPASSVKNLPQQQARSQQPHTQISFATNPKSSTAQVQPASSTQSPSPPVMVGSPTTSSMSKNTGSPRTTSASTASNKISQSSSLSSQQAKNTPVPARKSSPVGGRNVPSILNVPQLTPSSSTGSKSQLPQQQKQQQQQISKQVLPQAQLYFSNPYVHSQSNSSTSTTTVPSNYYLPRRGPEQMQRSGSSGNSPAANNVKGSSALPTQGLLHPAQFAAMQPSGNHPQFVPTGFSYAHVHSVPPVQVKPAEQKQPAGE
ncbi:protein TIME FOR COFFEE isoform X2 [Vigna umbellata]|uniref:protein TIME FOR COFFEE isoform X2 n=1 Tax=Vigna umbellata TaxID=87088 RepID=UPI001F5F5F03|nr:protein TIME FOR COFFEE isoform X2 [Vigna umbellata]